MSGPLLCYESNTSMPIKTSIGTRLIIISQYLQALTSYSVGTSCLSSLYRRSAKPGQVDVPPVQMTLEKSSGLRSGCTLFAASSIASAKPAWRIPTSLGQKMSSGTRNLSLFNCSVGICTAGKQQSCLFSRLPKPVWPSLGH